MLPASVRGLRDAINSHDAQRVGDVFTPDYRAIIPLHPSLNFTGNDLVVWNWAGIFVQIPDIQAEVLRTALNGNEVWSEWRLTGARANGDAAELGGPVIWVERDGLIAHARFYLDPVTAPAAHPAAGPYSA
ncbi:nuclear transport factor 2 family protein [Streptomyces sp. A1136]|uniref:nuclear transport factor 2 family protein n=1 Tax=Streptomyces sp. A1136 TaxID=2563102 RepID=UPI001F0FCFFE|nr:nuclear transport factor 2 family protein [Streptomyces sp. A1136]